MFPHGTASQKRNTYATSAEAGAGPSPLSELRSSGAGNDPNSGQWLGFVGFDNMDARRVAAEGGFDWLFECGVGSNFCAPRVSWHSLPPDRQIAKRIFESAEKRSQASRFAQTLQRMPGDCGVVRFENIQATAPSLGLTAAAYAIAEAVNYLKGETRPYAGSAYLWSPLLPFERNALTMPLSSLEAA